MWKQINRIAKNQGCPRDEEEEHTGSGDALLDRDWELFAASERLDGDEKKETTIQSG